MHPPRPAGRTGRRARPRHAAPRQPLPLRLAARAVISVVVPLLGVAWLGGSSDVTLQVDGDPHELTTHARTVEELLDRADVSVDEHDQVVPPPETPVQDGMVVEVVHAREITLLIGGDKETVLVTALSVDDVIEQLLRRRGVSRRSHVRPSRLTPVVDGMTVTVFRPVGVTVVVGGRERSVVTDASTVEGVLRRLTIHVDGNDRVTPSPETSVSKGMRITVERVRITRERREVAVPYPTEQRPTDALDAGQERVVQQGRDGVETVLERVTFVDGNEVLRTPINRRVVARPRTRIVEVGTRTREPDNDAASSGSNTSTGRPRAASQSEPEPEAEPEPDASNSRSQTGQASYYYHPEEGMTAAHRTLPLGTVVTVTNRANGKSIRVTINDRGPYVGGRIIDLNEPAFTQIAAKSAGVIDVRITW